MRMAVRGLYWLLIIGCWLYTLAICALVLLWSLKGGQIWWVDLSNAFAWLFFLPLAVLVPVALITRSWPLRMASGGVLLLFFVLFGSNFVPLIQSSGGTPNLRVVSFNQRYTNPQIDLVIAELRAQNADLIALQELSPAMAAAIEQELKTAYPYQWLEPADNARGIGMISRHPLRPDGHLLNGLVQRAQLSLLGQQVTVLNVHLHFTGLGAGRSERFGGLPMIYDYKTSGRTEQVRDLVKEVDTISGPLLAMGDHNTGDREPGYAIIASRLNDTYRSAASGFGFTFPNQGQFGPLSIPFPLIRIDYIWTSTEFTPVNARTNCQAIGADHCMLIADLRLNG